MKEVKKLHVSTSIFIGTVIAVAVVFGGGAYLYVNNKAEKEKKDLNAQITELQNQVSSAKNAITMTAPSAEVTTDDTANWKTYKNDIYNYSIKYDTGWTVSVSDREEGQTERLSSVWWEEKATFDDAFVVVQVLRNTYSDIDAWAHAMNDNELGVVYAIQDTKVAGVSAKRLTIPDLSIMVGLIKEDKLYVISLGYCCWGEDQKEKDKLDSTYEKMLSSFKFLK